MPLINSNALLDSGYSRQDILEAVLLVWGQGQHHVDRVYSLPQEDLPGRLCTVAFPKLLQQQEFLTVSQFSRFTGPKHLVQGVE